MTKIETVRRLSVEHSAPETAARLALAHRAIEFLPMILERLQISEQRIEALEKSVATLAAEMKQMLPMLAEISDALPRTTSGKVGTLAAMHFQKHPFAPAEAQTKLKLSAKKV